jgi:cell division septum initiation protein DivIVA
MAINFSEILDVEQRKSILEQRIAQFAAEGYQHELNKTVSENTENEAGVEESEKMITILSAAIEVYQKELDALVTTE